MKKTIFDSGINGFGDKYTCRYDWPDNIALQCGKDGIAMRSDRKIYHTSFFGAFPKEPRTFIRGEGKTIRLAEKDAWDKYQKIVNCKEHDFDRMGFTTGIVICRKCGLASFSAEPLTSCCICGNKTAYSYDIDGNWYCENDVREKPLEKFTTIDWLTVSLENKNFDRTALYNKIKAVRERTRKQ